MCCGLVDDVRLRQGRRSRLDEGLVGICIAATRFHGRLLHGRLYLLELVMFFELIHVVVVHVGHAQGRIHGQQAGVVG